MTIVRHHAGPDGRWWRIEQDPRQPAIVRLRPMSGIGQRSTPITVTSLEAAIDYVAKQQPKGPRDGK